MKEAFHKLSTEIADSYEKAVGKFKKHKFDLEKEYREEVGKLLDTWGCKKDCSADFANPHKFDHSLVECKCPAAYGIKYTKTPLDKIKFEKPKPEKKFEIDYDITDLAAVKTDAKKTDAKKKPAAAAAPPIPTIVIPRAKGLHFFTKKDDISPSFWALIAIAAVQTIFCLSICFWVNCHHNKKADRLATQNQKDFNSFLYQFHKQMADEE